MRIICDIDGTITKVGDRLKYLEETPKNWDAFYSACGEDEPNTPIIELLKAVSEYSSIVFITGRRESCRQDTIHWIKTHCPWLHRYRLFMRKNGDFRHDITVKHELAIEALLSPLNTLFVLEDRNSMVEKWRELGFTCLQVAEGDF